MSTMVHGFHLPPTNYLRALWFVFLKNKLQQLIKLISLKNKLQQPIKLISLKNNLQQPVKLISYKINFKEKNKINLYWKHKIK